MRCIAAKFVPQILTNDQKQQCVNTCLELWRKANEDPNFSSISRIITCDKSWIYGYDPVTKQQSSLWKSPQSPSAKKARQVQSSTRSMLIVSFFFFLAVKGIVHREFFLLTLRSTLTFTATFWDAWEKMCNEKDRNFGATTTGSFIMTELKKMTSTVLLRRWKNDGTTVYTPMETILKDMAAKIE
jgi:hypothetical protein